MKGTLNARAVTATAQLVLPGLPESTVAAEDLGDTWSTPSALTRGLVALTGVELGLDVCAEAWSAKAPVWWGPGSPHGEDGLAQDWRFWFDAARWCNPPYATIDPWVARAIALEAAPAPGYLLVPARTDRRWWHALDAAAERGRAWVTWIGGRIEFSPPPGVVAKNRAPGGVVLWQVGGRRRLLPRRIHKEALLGAHSRATHGGATELA